jgi:hypothetical protein
MRPNRATRALALQEVFYFCGHRAVYDAETLELPVRIAGFVQGAKSDFGESAIVLVLIPLLVGPKLFKSKREHSCSRPSEYGERCGTGTQ